MMQWQQNKRFKVCYPHILMVEGGFLSAEKAKTLGDSGGATHRGIAFNYNKGILKRYGILQPNDIVNLTKEQAIEIYYEKYWTPSKADELPDTRLALVYFDMVVNSGQGTADKLLNLLNKSFWGYEGDGKNETYFWATTLQYMLQREYAYTKMKEWDTFGEGWTNRLLKIGDALKTIKY